MLVVFINGPWEGRTITDPDPPIEYRVPVLEPELIDESRKKATSLRYAVYRQVKLFIAPSKKKVVLYSSE